ncbi:PEP-CTERM sorting domain-containing protein [Pseudoduganella sp. SL102]|uniref:PEP-CTERM sorting domain-containing protein n=1 Tax=Pseudoduganella sp. SL102 TaxID=2995154 RepID=UPI00248C00E0|nr:PEP-CTERM sorting domain-containing protein [Pseudoduganella sp. SL102]WBS01521.1 PEP-CTERM sorting domain-containing protein [Pseudoduganella sp. SL102]
MALAAALPAHGASVIETRTAFSNVQLSVRDLAPDDGIAANYAIVPTSYTALSSFAALGPNDLELTRYEDEAFADLGQAGSASISAGQATTWVRTDGSLGSLETFASFPGPSPAGHLYSSGIQYFRVDLAAHSELWLSGDYAMSISRQGDDLGTQSANVSMLAQLSDQGRTVQEDLDLWARQDEPGGQRSGHFNLGFANDSDVSTRIYLYMTSGSSTYGNEPLAAIPEPQTYAMFGAGLLLLAARRKFARK